MEQPATPGIVLERPTLSGTIRYTALPYVRDSPQKSVQLLVVWDDLWETAARDDLWETAVRANLTRNEMSSLRYGTTRINPFDISISHQLDHKLRIESSSSLQHWVIIFKPHDLETFHHQICSFSLNAKLSSYFKQEPF